MAMNKGSAVLISILITALVAGGVAGGGVYLLMGRQAAGLKQDTAALESANADLQAQIDALQEQTAEEPDENGDDGAEITQAPKPGWEAYFPEPDSTTLMNEEIGEVRRLLGEPPFKLRSIAAEPANNREIWIYIPYAEDLTGLYLYFKGNRVSGSRLDEFNGLYGSGLLDGEDFWLR